MIELQCRVFGPYQTNAYLLLEHGINQAILIDAPGEAEAMLSWIGAMELKYILLTHGHEDHVGALERIRRIRNAPVAIHAADAEKFGIEADAILETGATFTLGNSDLEVVHIPGHTPGSVALKILEAGAFASALVGDAIFPGGPGHTTTPDALQQSLVALEQTVFTWPDHIELHPGHGGSTTVGAEREAFAVFRSSPLSPDLHGDVLWR